MNLLLLTPDDLLADGHYRITGRRRLHLLQVLDLKAGDHCRAGLLNGALGNATLENINEDDIRLTFVATEEPPAPLPLTLVLALPRPKMLKRILIDATSLGVKTIILLNSWKVDKSYWQTPELKRPQLEEKMLLGLEQARDTLLPTLRLAPRFRPFVEDELPGYLQRSTGFIAHPGDHPPLPSQLNTPVTLAIGPEGGWTDYEATLLQQQGMQCGSFGSRILRVETAVPAIIGSMMQLK